MSYFVIRTGPPTAKRLFVHRGSYPSRLEAERHAWDDTRLNRHAGEPLDETQPPVVIEAQDIHEAIIEWLRQQNSDPAGGAPL